MADEAIRRLDALIQVGMRLARQAPTGRILLARIEHALDPAWIPLPWGEDIVTELRAARDAACKPIEWRAIERALRSAWGTDPSDELDEIDRDPVAVTPSAQVHRAVLNGSDVAVKVLRPGLAASVRQDLVLLEGLLAPLGMAFPALDPGAIVAEFRERVLDELDMEHEAMVQRRFHRKLRDHPFLTVPEPVTRLANEAVLVSEWIDGVPLRDAPSPDQAAAQLVLFVLGGVRSGLVHADPDPDDVLLLEDGRIAILDFGANSDPVAERVELAAEVVEAFSERDEASFARALERLGWLPAAEGEVALDLLYEVLGDLAGPDPVRLDSEAVLAARDRLFERTEPLVRLILAGALPPEDLWPARASVQLFAAIAQVGATAPWRELVRAAMRDGWAASVPVAS